MTVSRDIAIGWTHWTRIIISSGLFHHGRQVARRRLIQLRSASCDSRIRLFTTQTINPPTFGPPNPLPFYCPGCGASSQASGKSEAGHYSLNRSAVKAYLGHGTSNLERKNEQDAIVLSALQDHRKDAFPKDLTEAHRKHGV